MKDAKEEAREIAKTAVANIVSDFPEVDKLIISEKELAKKIQEFASQERLKGITEGFNAAREVEAPNDTPFGSGPLYKNLDDYLNSKP